MEKCPHMRRLHTHTVDGDQGERQQREQGMAAGVECMDSPRA